MKKRKLSRALGIALSAIMVVSTPLSQVAVTAASGSEETTQKWTIGYDVNTNGPEKGKQGVNGWYFMSSEELNKDGKLDVSKMKENKWDGSGSCWKWYGTTEQWMPETYLEEGYPFQENSNWWLMDGNGRLDTNVTTGAMTGAYVWEAQADGDYDVTVDYKAGSKDPAGDGVTISLNTKEKMVSSKKLGAAANEDELETGKVEGSVSLVKGDKLYIAVDPNEKGNYDYASLKIDITRKVVTGGEGEGGKDDGDNKEDTPGTLTPATYEDAAAIEWTLGKDANTNGPKNAVQGYNGWYALYTEETNVSGAVDASQMKENTWKGTGSCWSWYGTTDQWMPDIYLGEGYDLQGNSNWWLMDGNGRLDTNVTTGAVSGAYAWAAPADGKYEVEVSYTAGSKALDGDGVTLSLNTKNGVKESVAAPAVENQESLKTGMMKQTVELKSGELVYLVADPGANGSSDYADLDIVIKKSASEEEPVPEPDNGLTKPVYEDASATEWTLGKESNTNGPKNAVQGYNGWYALYTEETNVSGAVDASQMKENEWNGAGSCWKWWGITGQWMPGIYLGDGYPFQENSNWWLMDGNGRLDTNVTIGAVSGAYAWAAPDDGKYEVEVSYTAGSKALDGDGVTLSLNTKNGVKESVEAPAVENQDSLKTGTMKQTVELKSGELIYLVADPGANGSSDYAALEIAIKKSAEEEPVKELTKPVYEDASATEWTLRTDDNVNGPKDGVQGYNGWYALYTEETGSNGAVDVSQMKENEWNGAGSCWKWYGTTNQWMPGIYLEDGYPFQENSNWWLMDGKGRLDTNVTKGAVSGAYAWAAPTDGEYEVEINYKAGSKSLDGDGVTLSLSTKDEMRDAFSAPAAEGTDNLATGVMKQTVTLKAGELVYINVDPNGNGSDDYAELEIVVKKQNGSEEKPDTELTKPVYDDASATTWTLGQDKNVNGPKAGVQGANGWYALYTEQTNADGALNVGQMKENDWSDHGSCYQWYTPGNMWIPGVYTQEGYDLQGNANWWMMNENGHLEPNVETGAVTGAYAWAAPADGDYEVTLDYVAGQKSMTWDGVTYYGDNGLTVSINTKAGMEDKVFAPAVSEEKPDLSTGTLTKTISLKAGELVYFAVDPGTSGSYDTSDLKIKIHKAGSEEPEEPAELTTPTYEDTNASVWTMGKESNTNGPKNAVQGYNGWYALYTKETGKDGAIDVSKMKENIWDGSGSCYKWYGITEQWMPGIYLEEGYDIQANSNWWLMDGNGRLDTNVTTGAVTGAYAWAAPADGEYEVEVGYKAGSSDLAGDGVTLSLNTKDAVKEKQNVPAVNGKDNLKTGTMKETVTLKAGELVYITVDPNAKGNNDYAELEITVSKVQKEEPEEPAKLTTPTYEDANASEWTMGKENNTNGPKNAVQGYNGWYALYTEQINADGAIDVSKMKENIWDGSGSCYKWYGTTEQWMPDVYLGEGYDVQANSNWWLMDGNGRLDTNVTTGAVTGAYAWAAPADGEYEVEVGYKAGSNDLAGDGVTLSLNTKDAVKEKQNVPAVNGKDNLKTGTMKETLTLKAGELVYITVDPNAKGNYDYAELEISIKDKAKEPAVDSKVWTLGKETNTNGPENGVQGHNGWYAMYTEQINADGAIDVSKMKENIWDGSGSCYKWYGITEQWMPDIYLGSGYDVQVNSNWWLMDGNGRLDTNVTTGAVTGAYVWQASEDGNYRVTVHYKAGSKDLAGDGVTISLNTAEKMLEKVNAPAAENEKSLMTGTLLQDVQLKAGERVYVVVDPNAKGNYDYADLEITVSNDGTSGEDPGFDPGNKPGDKPGDNTGDNTGGNTGDNTGDNTGGNTGGGSIGSSSTGTGIRSKATYADANAKKWTLGYEYFGKDSIRGSQVAQNMNGPKAGVQGYNGWYFLWTEQRNVGAKFNVGSFRECVWANKGSCFFFYDASDPYMWIPDVYVKLSNDEVQANANWWMMNQYGYLHPNVSNNTEVSGAYAWKAPVDGTYTIKEDYVAGGKSLTWEGVTYYGGSGVTLSMLTADGALQTVKAPSVSASHPDLYNGSMTQNIYLKAGDVVYFGVDPNKGGDYDYANLRLTIDWLAKNNVVNADGSVDESYLEGIEEIVPEEEAAEEEEVQDAFKQNKSKKKLDQAEEMVEEVLQDNPWVLPVAIIVLAIVAGLIAFLLTKKKNKKTTGMDKKHCQKKMRIKSHKNNCS